jgi:uncharacterized repeat protein (TIGR01451 family)
MDMPMTTREYDKRDRRDWIIILVILLIGFLCILLAGGWALRFSPSWRLNTSMDSRLDPNSDFNPSGFFDPLDPAILTRPAWMDIFLTPGASFETRTPAPSPTSVNTATPSTATLIPTITPLPTNTPAVFPNPTSTKKSKPSTPVPPTNTNIPSLSVDLQITKTDGVANYTPGTSVTYTIVVSNAGPANMTGATVTDTFPSVISATWTCASTGGATCTANGSGNINDTVNVPVGGLLTYTVTANIASSATGSLSNTASVAVPSGYTDTNNGNNSATDTDNPAPSADLGITKNDGYTGYARGDTMTYTIVVSNNGPSDVSGATVTDVFSNANIASASWTCSATGSATCTANGSGNINDTVNIPAGSTLTYTVTVNIVSSPSGDLDNTATVTSSTDPVPGNNSATDTDILLLGSTPDGSIYSLLAGGTLTLNIPVDVDGDLGTWDLVYYELSSSGGILLDLVIIQIGDGSNWYTVFNWGDNNIDPNTNLTGYLQANLQAPNPEEPDQRNIPAAVLYGPLGTGVAIDVDGLGIPAGTYPYIRIIAPTTGDVDGQLEVDAIEILP